MADFDWANASVAKVLDLYIAWFNRVPDVDGMAGWITKLQSGESIESVSAQFLAAAYQFTDQTGYTAAMTDHQFIVKLYEGVLGRSGNLAPVESETSYWKTALAEVGGNRGELVLRMLAEAKAFNAEGRPEIQAIIDTLNNKTEVSKYALDQGITYSSAELSIIQGKAFLDGINGTTQSATDARGEVDSYFGTMSVPTFTVQQVLSGSASGTDYKLLDTLANIASAPAVKADAVSYLLSNALGHVGELNLDVAGVLHGAGNAASFSFSIAGTAPVLLAAVATQTALLMAAEAVVVKGTDAGTEVLNFTNFPRGVIIDAGDGNDHLYGTAFSDLLIGGRSTNFYRGNGGEDIMQLADDGQDLVFLTRATAGGEFKAGDRIYVTGFGPGDKILLSQADTSADLQGSWTPDDLLRITQAQFVQAQSSLGNFFGDSAFSVAAHAFGVFEFEGALLAGTDLSLATDGSQLLHGLGVGPGFAKDFWVREQLAPNNHKPNWQGFLVAYNEDNQAYVYYAGPDSRLDANDIRLVGVFDAPDGAADKSWITTDHFQLWS